MGAGEGKQGKGLVRSWAQRYLNLGFVAGFLLVLLTYIVVTQQFAITSPDGTLDDQRPNSILSGLARRSTVPLVNSLYVHLQLSPR